MAKGLRLQKTRRLSRPVLILISILVVGGLVGGYLIFRRVGRSSGHFVRLREYWSDPEDHPDWGLKVGEQCEEAPFLQPTNGFVAFFWGDFYRNGRKHQGIDIFGPTGPDGLGETPVVAAYDGYLTRQSDWRSALIMRVPQDPLQPGRQIWLYYTHMADAEGNSFIQPEFPPGTFEEFIPAGTLLGYQGNYSADPNNPTGMHLHFSIVLDDGNGNYRNELEHSNTLDPSPYLGFQLESASIGSNVAACKISSPARALP
jgi:peptidoglycan LD-endopeptidase LytH